jgi:Leucine-rich repeat (LRR) protein
LTDLEGFSSAVAQITDGENIKFLDFSFNKFDEIHDDIASFKNLSSLYLTGNNIRTFRDVLKLKGLNLRALSLHGNPITQRKNYRLKVLHLIPSLHKLDFTAITRADRDRVKTWAKIWGPENESLTQAKLLRATARSLEREKNSK